MNTCTLPVQQLGPTDYSIALINWGGLPQLISTNSCLFVYLFRSSKYRYNEAYIHFLLLTKCLFAGILHCFSTCHSCKLSLAILRLVSALIAMVLWLSPGRKQPVMRDISFCYRVVHGLARLGRLCQKVPCFDENYIKLTKINSGTWHTDSSE